MILNYKQTGPLEEEFSLGRVLVDGQQVNQVHFVDTVAGFVETYDVDETHRPTFDGIDGVKSRRVSGTIRLFWKDGTEWAA